MTPYKTHPIKGTNMDWHNAPRRYLDVVPDPDPAPIRRIVACVNVWQDIDELRNSVRTWIHYVDGVVAVDGKYAAMVGPTRSTDGSIEWLAAQARQFGIPFRVIKPPGGVAWPNQVAKRSAYCAMDHGDDAVLFIVDADESIAGAPDKGEWRTFAGDVGWVKITSPLYERAQDQPRLVRWVRGLHYDRRHHHLAIGTQSLTTHQSAAPGFDHRTFPIHIHNTRGGFRRADRQAVDRDARGKQHNAENDADPGPRSVGIEALHVLQTGPFDPAGVIFQLHAAINGGTPHASVMCVANDQYTSTPAQFYADRDQRSVTSHARTADIIHCHVNFGVPDDMHLWGDAEIVMHHHGTELRRDPVAKLREDDAHGVGLRLVSNLELCQYAPAAVYLPNPIPIGRLQRWAARMGPPARLDDDGPFVIAHTPSKPEIKNTAEFLAACERLNRAGLKIEPVVVTGRPMVEALAAKARAHAVFDSLSLGMQCAGLEGAAFGVPVIAGDPVCRDEYNARLGYVPYTDATAATLADTIERLATEPDFYLSEAGRVTDYVASTHDVHAVVLQYLDILDAHFHWRLRMEIGDTPGLRHTTTTKG